MNNITLVLLLAYTVRMLAILRNIVRTKTMRCVAKLISFIHIRNDSSRMLRIQLRNITEQIPVNITVENLCQIRFLLICCHCSHRQLLAFCVIKFLCGICISKHGPETHLIIGYQLIIRKIIGIIRIQIIIFLVLRNHVRNVYLTDKITLCVLYPVEQLITNDHC